MPTDPTDAQDPITNSPPTDTDNADDVLVPEIMPNATQLHRPYRNSPVAYDPTELATMAYVHGQQIQEIAKHYKVDRATVSRWLQKPEVQEIRLRVSMPHIKRDLALQLGDIAKRAASAITDQKLAKSRPGELSQVMSRSISDLQLLTGQATEIRELRVYDVDALLTKLNSL